MAGGAGEAPGSARAADRGRGAASVGTSTPEGGAMGASVLMGFAPPASRQQVKEG